jgi:hypothetical protein
MNTLLAYSLNCLDRAITVDRSHTVALPVAGVYLNFGCERPLSYAALLAASS